MTLSKVTIIPLYHEPTSANYYTNCTICAFNITLPTKVKRVPGNIILTTLFKWITFKDWVINQVAKTQFCTNLKEYKIAIKLNATMTQKLGYDKANHKPMTTFSIPCSPITYYITLDRLLKELSNVN